MRSTSVVRTVQYGRGRIAYGTYDAPAPAEDVLRLAFPPKRITADGKPLPSVERLSANGYAIKPLRNGDCIVAVRHDGCRDLVVEGDDPQQEAEDEQLQYVGDWSRGPLGRSFGRETARQWAGRGRGLADVRRQPGATDRPGRSRRRPGRRLSRRREAALRHRLLVPRDPPRQVLCYKNGLAQGRHVLKVVVRGSKNPCLQRDVTSTWTLCSGPPPKGKAVLAKAAALRNPSGSSSATRAARTTWTPRDFAWRPATEFVMRLKTGADLVPIAFWTGPRLKDVAGTADAELYRYGVHGRDFTAYFTVAPAKTYHVRLKFCQAEMPQPARDATSIDLQGRELVADMDIAATAGGLGRAVDLIFNCVRPKNGASPSVLASPFGRGDDPSD